MAVGTPEDFGLDEYGFFRQADPRMIGQSWVDHGYRPTPTFDTVEDCPVCGAPQTTCTDETHRAGMQVQQLVDTLKPVVQGVRAAMANIDRERGTQGQQ